MTPAEHHGAPSVAQPRRPLTLVVCVGGDCRRADRFPLVAALAAEQGPGCRAVVCQGICDGPVVGLAGRGPTRWYARLSAADVRRMREVLRTDGARRPLRRRERRGRRGKLRKPERMRPFGDGGRRR